jgi:hypothetical protein
VNKSPESQSPKLKAIRSRWLACTQSTGRVGKSTAAEGIITWLRYAGVAYAAYDADGEHRTLSSRYPDDVEKFDAANSPEEFGRLLEQISEDFPVTLVDFPAQATRFLLSSVEHFRMVDIFGRRGTFDPPCSSLPQTTPRQWPAPPRRLVFSIRRPTTS